MWVGPKYNHMYPNKREAGRVLKEEEAACPQNQNQSEVATSQGILELSEAERDKEQIHPQNLEREPGPAKALISGLWPLEL